MAPAVNSQLFLSQADKDGLFIICWADLPRQTMRYALRRRDLLNYFDSLVYAEMFPELTASELRLLNDASTLWIRTPADVDYSRVLALLPARKRMIPRAIRLLGRPVDNDAKLEENDNNSPEDS